MMIKVEKNPKANKTTNKRKKMEQLTPRCLKLLENDLMQDGVESVCNVYLEHHAIKMGIQIGSINMDCSFTTSFNHHPELIW
jgi:hypothetical protein